MEEKRRKIQRVSLGVEDHCHWCASEGALLLTRMKG